MMYNKVELKAMQMIASKLNWNKPAYETVETITKMVWNQQSLELDCIGVQSFFGLGGAFDNHEEP